MAEKEVITLTTETRQGRMNFLVGMAFIGLLCVALASAPAWAEMESGEGPGVGAYAFASVLGLGLFIFLLVWLRERRGTWRVTERGIEWISLRGRRRHLSWDAVERVHVWEFPDTLKAGKITITVPWDELAPKERREPARQLVIESLRPHFDLPDRRREQIAFPQSFQTARKGIGRILGVTIPYTVVLIGGMWVFGVREVLGDRWSRIVCMVWILLFLLLVPLLILAFCALQEHRRGWLARRPTADV